MMILVLTLWTALMVLGLLAISLFYRHLLQRRHQGQKVAIPRVGRILDKLNTATMPMTATVTTLQAVAGCSSIAYAAFLLWS